MRRPYPPINMRRAVGCANRVIPDPMPSPPPNLFQQNRFPRWAARVLVRMALSTRRWLRDPVALLAVGLTAYAAMYAVGVAVTAPTNAAVQTILLAAFLPMDVGIVALAWIAAARIPREGSVGVRRALELTGVGFVAVLGGAVARFVYANWFGGDPENGWVNLPHLLLYPCWLVALLALPRAQRMPAERRKFLYDAATTLLGVGIAVWHLVLIPAIRAEPRTGFTHFLSVADAAGAIALVLGLTTVWLQRPRRDRGPFVMLLLSIALYAASGLAGLLVHVHAGQMAAPWMSLTFMGPYVLLVWACQRYASHPPEAAREGSSMGRGRVQPFSPLPYVALAACYVLLLGEAVRHADEHWASLAEGTLLVTLLIVLRQLAAVRENARLVAETAALENEARFRALVQHSSDVIAIADGQGFLRFISPSVTRWFGYEPRELEGAQLMSLLHPGRCGAWRGRIVGCNPARRVHHAHRMAHSAPRRTVARRGSGRHQSPVRAHGARHRAERARRERAQSVGSPAHPPGVPRSADGAREPRAVLRPRDACARARAASRRWPGRAVSRPGQLQDHQRQPWPCGRRPSARGCGGATRRQRADVRHRRSTGRG